MSQLPVSSRFHFRRALLLPIVLGLTTCGPEFLKVFVAEIPPAVRGGAVQLQIRFECDPEGGGYLTWVDPAGVSHFEGDFVASGIKAYLPHHFDCYDRVGTHFEGTLTVPIEVYASAPDRVAFSFSAKHDDVSGDPVDTAVVFDVISAAEAGTIDLELSGLGRVSSQPAGIDCPGTCSFGFALDESVTLTAVPDAGQALQAWTGCDQSSGTSCTVKANGHPRVSASFVAVSTAPRLSVIIDGDGTVSSDPPGIMCPPDCSFEFAPGASVTLNAQANAGSRFVSWSGDDDCSDGYLTIRGPTVCSVLFRTSGWQELTPTLSTAGGAGIALATDSALVPYVSVALAAGPDIELLVRRYENQAWTTLGNSRPNADEIVSSVAYTPALVLSATDAPIVAWPANGERVRVKRLDGVDWTTLNDNLNVDVAASVEGVQLARSGDQLVVAWIERDSGGFRRIVLKRRDPSNGTWSGGYVEQGGAVVDNAYAVRISLDPSGLASVFFARAGATASGEGFLHMVGEQAAGGWAEQCGTGVAIPPASVTVTTPNTRFGFGVLRLPDTRPIAVYNNGESIYALICVGGSWTGTDGSRDGRITGLSGPTVDITGDQIAALTVSQTDERWIAWTRTLLLRAGGTRSETEFRTLQGAGWMPQATIHERTGEVAQGQLSLTSIHGYPALAGVFVEQSNPIARVFRYSF